MTVIRSNKLQRFIGVGGRRGYTLIEVLIVVSIMGLIAAMVVPQMIKPGSLTIQAAGRMIIADIIYAQNEAIAKQQVRQVVFEPTDNRYRLTDSAGTTLGVSWKSGGSSASNYIVDFANDQRFAGVVMENADFGGSTTLAFDDLGVPTNGGSVDVVFADIRYRVAVAPFTGHVTIAPVP